MSATNAVVHTDIQGSTRLWEKLGPAFAPLLAEHNRLLREAARGGKELATEGDSFTFAFPSAADAVKFALSAQERLHAASWPEAAGALLVRMGIHSAGESPVPRARLIAGAAHGGQILLTAEAQAEAGSALEGAILSDLGEHRLAAHDRPERIFQVLPLSLSARTFPPPRTLSSRPTNILPERDRFIGRERELEELTALLPSPAGRLVTLTGPGGIGKSRLAREIALSLVPQFEGGCWFADLLEARSAADVSRAAAHALGIPLPAGDAPAAVVADALEFRKPMLLVLDGFEALVDHAAATVGLWVRKARHVRILVTSITLLGLSGEREFALGPLSSPAPARGVPTALGVGGFDAARLFVDRASRARPGFLLSDDNAAAVGRICADLEGIPLSLELAAARLAELTPDEMLRELESQFHLRDSSPTGGPRRRQSLAGTLDWSYGLLTGWQRSAFHQACAFRGGFFLESAEEVIDLSGEPDAPLAIDAVQALRDRSLLRTHDTPFGTRFSFFRAIREFGENRFRQSAGDQAWRDLEDRHARHFLAQARRWQPAPGSPATEHYQRLDLELDNFFAVHDRFVARAGAGDPGASTTAARACLALDVLLAWRGPFDQRVARLEAVRAAGIPDPAVACEIDAARAEALAAAGRTDDARAAAANAELEATRAGLPVVRARALLAVARLQMTGGDLERGAAQAAAARELFHAAGDVPGESRALDSASAIERLRGRLASAVPMQEESLALAKQAGDDPGIARAAANLGTLRHSLGDIPGAFAAFDEAEAHLKGFGSGLIAAKLCGMRGLVYVDQGEWARAEPLVQEAVSYHREAGLRVPLFAHLTALGRIRVGQGRIGEAAALYEEMAKLAGEIGDGAAIVTASGNLAMVRFRQGDLAGALELSLATAKEAKRLGLASSYAVNIGNAGMALLDLGRIEESRAAHHEAVESWRRQGGLKGVRAFNILKSLSDLESKSGNREAARKAALEACVAAEALRLEAGTDARLAGEARRMKEVAGGA